MLRALVRSASPLLALLPPGPDTDLVAEVQWEAQERSLRGGGSAYDVVEVGGEPAGRLVVRRTADEIRVLDVALLPAFRGRGVGTALLAALTAQGADSGIPVRLAVLPDSPAVRLYDRLGFTAVGRTGIHLDMEWTPQ